ncbi:hypothetical protein TNCV_4338881 [Trichonephila clavipes]|nr:hypothetical protein TNCV_4338881 [Trichonephila clavipes]
MPAMIRYLDKWATAAFSNTGEDMKVCTQGLLVTGVAILNHGQVTRMTLELAPTLQTTIPHQWEDFGALDRFNVHFSRTRRLTSGIRLKLMTHQSLVRVPDHYMATAWCESLVRESDISDADQFT